MPAFRTRRRKHVCFVCMTERFYAGIRIRIPANRTDMRGVTRFRTRRDSHFVLIIMTERGGIIVRVLIPADGTKVRSIALVRASGLYHDFRIGVLRSVRVIIPITLAAERTDVFRVSTRSAIGQVYDPIAVLMHADFLGRRRRSLRAGRHSRQKKYCREHRNTREQYPKLVFDFLLFSPL